MCCQSMIKLWKNKEGKEQKKSVNDNIAFLTLS